MSEETKIPEWQVLAEEIGERLLSGYPCIITIHNRTPPDWNVSIVAAAAKFFYQKPDGSPQGEPYTDYESNINVGAGGSVYLRSDFPDRCVRRADTVIYVKAGSEAPKPYGASEDVGVGVCLKSKEYILSPKKTIMHKMLSGSRLDLLKFISVE